MMLVPIPPLNEMLRRVPLPFSSPLPPLPSSNPTLPTYNSKTYKTRTLHHRARPSSSHSTAHPSGR